jgi:hypothetical protein
LVNFREDQPIKSRAFGFSIALALFALDQLAKWFVSGPLHKQAVGKI